MPSQKNAANEPTDPSSDIESVAERYLNLWQDNIRCWATDPDALEKWLADINNVKR